MTVSDMADRDKPLDEIIRIAGEEWADLDAAAFLKLESKTAEFSRLVNEHIAANPGIAFNRAESRVKASDQWREYLATMAEMRRSANRARVYYDTCKTRFKMWQSRNARAREERYHSR